MLLIAFATLGCDDAPRRVDPAPSAPLTDATARRIVSTMPSTTEMLIAFGAAERLVGVSIFCVIPPDLGERPSVGSGMDPSLEQILALEPDLVVGTITQSEFAFVSALERIGIPVFLLDDRSLESLYVEMVDLGERAGVGPAALAVVSSMQADLAELARQTAGLPPPSVLIVFDHDPIYAAGSESYADRLIRAAGGRNAVEGGVWVQLDRERVIVMAPDVILETTGFSREELVAVWSSLESVPAVVNGRIHPLVSEGVSRPGPSIPAAAREIARRLFPDRFPVHAP
jgi:iron complex transport system substrate-binding protein